MDSISIEYENLERIKAEVLKDSPAEGSVAGLVSHYRTERRSRFLWRETLLVPQSSYSERSPFRAVLKPEFVATVAQRARREGCGIAFVHSHPLDQGAPNFSHIDDEGELRLAEFLSNRLGHHNSVSLVVSGGGITARQLGSDCRLSVSQVGRFLNTYGVRSVEDQPKFDRQVRAFGKSGQSAIRAQRVGIVGLGGTGSVVAQQLSHLGVCSFVLIDDDFVDETNLNRLVGSSAKDIGRPKVSVAAEMIRRTVGDAEIASIEGSVLADSVARQLLSCDLIFCCTDSHGSRAILNQLAYQYLIPCIDMGVAIRVNRSQIEHITARVQMLSPGLACLTCSELLDPSEVRVDLMDDESRRRDPYVVGQREPQPAVVSLNSTAASLAVTMFMAVVTGIPMETRFQLYNGLQGTVRNIERTPAAMCIVCSSSGAFARGDTWPLPTRKA